jgi:hypothetical protein
MWVMLCLGQFGEANDSGHFSLIQPLSSKVIATAQNILTVMQSGSLQCKWYWQLKDLSGNK